MRTTLHGLWKARRGRRLVAATVSPFVELSRQRLELRAQAWLEPYVIGFMVMLITEIARRRLDPIDSDTLALIQSETWEDITGLTANLVAEETIRLSTIRDPLFESGCRNAIVFADTLCRSVPSNHPDTAWPGFQEILCKPAPHTFSAIQDDDDAVIGLWQAMFERQMTTPQSGAQPPITSRAD
jgi:hypothetical protein